MNAFLSPIEKPFGLVKKLAYYFTRKQFGKGLIYYATLSKKT